MRALRQRGQAGGARAGWLVALALVPCLAWAQAPPPAAGPLADYLRRTDPATAWVERSRGRYRDLQYRELVLTSQVWRGAAWRHQLLVLQPANAQPGRPCLLFVAGGSWRADYLLPPRRAGPPAGMAPWADLARALGAPVAVLLQVPSQPLFGQLREDELLAFTLDQYLLTGAGDWPLLVPMAKAVVTAMDAVQAVTRQEWALPPAGFLLAGASKRGWLTWLTAAADPRVVALAPMVFDMLRMDEQLELQRRSWGLAATEMGAFTRRQLPRRLATPRGRELLSIVDPWAYRQQLTQPKLIILATNDAYWPADALDLYWDGLPGPRNVLYLPNDRHVPDGLPRLFAALLALHRSVVQGQALPQLDWRFVTAGPRAELRLAPPPGPVPVHRARAWVAWSPTRDFRAAHWRARPMQRQADGSFRGDARLPAQGYLGLFGEVEFGAGSRRFPLSTGLRLFDRQGLLAAGEP